MTKLTRGFQLPYSLLSLFISEFCYPPHQGKLLTFIYGQSRYHDLNLSLFLTNLIAVLLKQTTQKGYRLMPKL